MMIQNEEPRRGCGLRIEGGIYAETLLSPYGQPVEDFLIDPPARIDVSALGLTSRGVRIVEINGVHHIFDIVGSTHYPNVADFVEEAVRFGVSRRLPRSLDFSRLSKESRVVLLHHRAHIENAAEYFKAMGAWPPQGWACPKRLPEHAGDTPPAMCAGLWWIDITGGQTTLTPDGPHGSQGLICRPEEASVKPVIRRMPAFEYQAWEQPDGVSPDYRLAIFMIVPISRLAVIRARDGGHEEAAQAASRGDIPVEIVER